MNMIIIFCIWKIPTIWKVFVATKPSLDITSFVSVLHAWLRQDQVHVYMCHYVPVSQCTGATDKVASQQLRSENTRFTVRVVHSGMGGGSGGGSHVTRSTTTGGALAWQCPHHWQMHDTVSCYCTIEVCVYYVSMARCICFMLGKMWK